MATKPLIIKDFDQGIADSPHKGFQLMKNVDIGEKPGAVMANRQTTELFHTPLEVEFTADAGTDVITLTSGELPSGIGVAVTVSNSGGALPGGLAAATNYFLRPITSTTATLHTTIANAVANTKIDITDAGTGTHTIATVDPGIIEHITYYSGPSVYIYLDDNGRVWYTENGFIGLLNGNTLTNASGGGMCFFVNSDDSAVYLFVFRNALVDVVEITALSDLRTPSWSNGWQSLNTAAGGSNSHYCIKGQDNILYFCDDKYIGSIKENTGQVFDPANAATYTYSNQALDLPSGEIAYWLAELGTNLLISANTSDKIYPWDRTSDSFYLPLTVPEKEVWKIKNIGEIVYIQAGRRGNIYQTQGAYVRLFKTIPLSVLRNSASSASSPMGYDGWGGLEGLMGSLIVGVDGASTGNDGVYKFYTDGRFVIDNQPPSGSAKVTALYTLGNNYKMGYDGGACNGAEAGTRYSNYETVIHSRLYRVATSTEKATFSTLEVVTAKVPSSGTDYVRIKYRTNNNPAATFTTLKEFTFTSSTEAIQKSDIGLIDIENIQGQIEMSGNAELVEVRFLP